MLSSVQNAGVSALSGGAADTLLNFKVGATAGFAPDPAGSAPIPSVTWTGDVSKIFKTIITPHEVVLTFKIPHTEAITIGNLMVYLTGNIPFIWMVLPFPQQKAATNEVAGRTGDAYLFQYRLGVSNITTRINFSGVADYYATAPHFNTLNDMPQTINIPGDQAVVDNIGGDLAFATRFEQEWWGVSNCQEYNNTSFFSFDSGVAGDDHIKTL